MPWGRPYTAAEDAEILIGFAQGLLYEEIGGKVGRTRKAINTRILMFGLRRMPIERSAPLFCHRCGATVIPRTRQRKPGRLHFCSRSCRHKWRRIYPDKKTLRRATSHRASLRKRTGREMATHTEAEWTATLARYKNKCANCGAKNRLERDHIVPLSRGGTDHITNIQPLCRSCNARKSAKRTQLL